MPNRRSRLRQTRFTLVAAVFVLTALLVNVPAPARGSPSAASNTPPAQYTVTWNGGDVSSAGSASSALVVDFTQQANLLFSWNLTSPNTADVSDARVQMYYFGFAVATRDQILTNPVPRGSGTIPLSWTPLSVAYLLEGVYRITASFIAANGSTLFSENFYVRDNAPFGVVAILPIVLIVIVLYEVYGLARSGRYAMLGRAPKVAGPGAEPPKSGGRPTETPPETGTAGEGATESGAPPSGGSS